MKLQGYSSMIIDTHCHLDVVLGEINTKLLSSLSKNSDLSGPAGLIKNAQAAGVAKFINVGCDIITSKNSLFLSEQFEAVYATVGMHPTECNFEWKENVGEIKKLAKNFGRAKLVGIGEIGLDFFHKPYDEQKQKDACLAQIDLALSLNLPVSFHVRDAGDQFLKLVEPFRKELRAVIHCFQQDKTFAEVVIDWGFYLGIDGPITYPKNDSLRSIVKSVGLKKILLETDAPFLSPQPLRGKPNQSANLTFVAEEIAKIYDISMEEVAAQTWKNANDLFLLDKF